MKLLSLIVLSVLLAAGALSVTGCNTAHGLGEDMENAGEAIQDNTN
jgi:predicted small secreted protein